MLKLLKLYWRIDRDKSETQGYFILNWLLVIVKLTVVKETNITSTGGCNKAAGRQVWQDRDQFRYYLAAQLSTPQWHQSNTGLSNIQSVWTFSLNTVPVLRPQAHYGNWVSDLFSLGFSPSSSPENTCGGQLLLIVVYCDSIVVIIVGQTPPTTRYLTKFLNNKMKPDGTYC